MFIYPHEDKNIGVHAAIPTIILTTETKPRIRWLKISLSLSSSEINKALARIVKDKTLFISLKPSIGRVSFEEAKEKVTSIQRLQIINNQQLFYRLPNNEHLVWLIENFTEFKQLGIFVFKNTMDGFIRDIKALLASPDVDRIDQVLGEIEFLISFGFDGTSMYIQTRKPVFNEALKKIRSGLQGIKLEEVL